MSKAAVFGSFVVDLMARSPRLPVPGETVKGSVFKMGSDGQVPAFPGKRGNGKEQFF